MKYLKLFEDFKTKDDVLYIFDFDDTIVDSPEFQELVIKYLKEEVTVKSLLKRSLKQIGKEESDIKIEHGKIYVSDPKSEIEVKGNWVRKKERVYLLPPDRFYYSEISLPEKLKETAKIYKKAENKAIVTGRIKNMKSKIERRMEVLGLEAPNLGLHCYPIKNIDGDRVPEWKAKTIIKLIKETQFKKVVFYEDNSKWLRKVTKIVREKLPEIDFQPVKV